MSFPPDPSTRLNTSSLASLEGVLELVAVDQPVGLDVVQDGILVEVVADHLGHIRIDELVVGDAVSDRVRHRHPTGPRSVHEPWTTDEGLRPELQRVEVLVVHAPVDDMDRYLAVGGLQVHVHAVAGEVPPLYEMNSHQACEKRVLVEGGVVDAGCQHDDVRVRDTRGSRSAERLDEAGGVVSH